MKRTDRSTWIVSIALLSLLMLGWLFNIQRIAMVQTRFSSNMLKVGFSFSSTADSKFSLSIAKSDFSINDMILSNLVGTLVKYSASGKIEPYLASEFNVSQDGLVWTFKIRDNLTCQSGTPITGSSFAKNLTSQLKNYSKISSTMDFELLQGWSQFKKGSKTLSGVTGSTDSLEFHFTKKPQDFLELLRMPYFGFWCNSDDTLNTIESFISSGPYQVDTAKSSDNRIILNKRPEWFSVSIESIDNIEFSFLTDAQIDNSDYDMIQYWGVVPPQLSHNQVIVKTPPTGLNALILSPYFNGPFKNIQNRRAFLQGFRQHQKSATFLKSSFFYLTATSILDENDFSFTKDMEGTSITFAFSGKSNNSPIRNEIIRISRAVLAKAGANLNVVMKDPFEDNWRDRLLTNAEFDARVNSVSIGGHVENSIVKMIFCSNLGASYPDPSGRICKLTKNHDGIGGPVSEEYIREFNQALYDDAVVVPMLHYGTSWILSDKINPSTLPSTSDSPLFEAIRFK